MKNEEAGKTKHSEDSKCGRGLSTKMRSGKLTNYSSVLCLNSPDMISKALNPWLTVLYRQYLLMQSPLSYCKVMQGVSHKKHYMEKKKKLDYIKWTSQFTPCTCKWPTQSHENNNLQAEFVQCDSYEYIQFFEKFKH